MMHVDRDTHIQMKVIYSLFLVLHSFFSTMIVGRIRDGMKSELTVTTTEMITDNYSVTYKILQ